MKRYVVYDETTGEIEATYSISNSQDFSKHPLETGKKGLRITSDAEWKKVTDIVFANDKPPEHRNRINPATKRMVMKENYKP